jgi:hypothetical protein
MYSDNPETFHALGPIGRAASILLGASVLTHLLATISDWHTYQVVRDYLGGKPDVEDAALNSADTFARLTSIPNVAISVAAAVVFVLWLWRARLNSEVFCRADHRYSHAWVLGSWICPGPNLFYPKAIVDDVWVASDRATPAWTDDLAKHRRITITSAWWACWVVAMLLDVVLRRILMWVEPTVGTLRLTAYSSTVALVLSAVSAALAMVIIRRVTAMQTSRPWIAWWDIDDEAVSGSPFPHYPEDDELEPAWAEPAYAGGPGRNQPMPEPLRSEPLYVETGPAPQPALVAASSAPLTLSAGLPAQRPSWNEQFAGQAADEPSRPALVGLPSLPSLPSLPELPSTTARFSAYDASFDNRSPMPEPPAADTSGEEQAWSPFSSMVEQWREEIEHPGGQDSSYAAYEEPVFAREAPDYEAGSKYSTKYDSYQQEEYTTESYRPDYSQDTQYFRPDFESGYTTESSYSTQRDYTSERDYTSDYTSDYSSDYSSNYGSDYGTDRDYTSETSYTPETSYTAESSYESPYRPEPAYEPEPAVPQESPPVARLSPRPDLPQAPSLPQAPLLPQAPFRTSEPTPEPAPEPSAWPSSAGDQPAWVAEYQARRQPRGASSFQEPPRPIPSPPTPPLTLVPPPAQPADPTPVQRTEPQRPEPQQPDPSSYGDAARHFDPTQYSEPARYSETTRHEPPADTTPYAEPAPDSAPRPAGRRARRMPADYVEQPPADTTGYTEPYAEPRTEPEPYTEPIRRPEPPPYSDPAQYRGPAQQDPPPALGAQHGRSLPPAPLEPRGTFVDVEPETPADTGSLPATPRVHPRRRWSV